jgi:hypothetical protein
MIPFKSKLTLAYALYGRLAVLLVVSSIVGLLYGSRGLYEPYPASLDGLGGQDATTLVVGLPLLAITMWLTQRVWLGDEGGSPVCGGLSRYWEQRSLDVDVRPSLSALGT